MNEMSNNIKFLQEVSERAMDPLHQRKLQLKSDLMQERKNQSEQSDILTEEKNSTFGAHLDEINRIKQEKLDKLNSDIDQMTNPISEMQKKVSGLTYENGKFREKQQVLRFLSILVLSLLGLLFMLK